MSPELPEALRPLAFLLGTWLGEGDGSYPTIEPFRYREEITFSHIGKPFLAYTQRTINLGTGLPAHAESGYWRSVGDGRIEVVLAHPTGIAEVATGTVEGTNVELASTGLLRTPTATEVTQLERTLTVHDDTVMISSLRMAAVGLPLTDHLSAMLERQ